MAVAVRPYQPADRAAVYEICVRTGDGGEDATGKFADADLLPDVYAGPYLSLEPDLAFVLDDEGRAVGYVLGTADSEGFARANREKWVPLVAPRHVRPPEHAVTEEDGLLQLLHDPGRMLEQRLSARYPAHLHIDVLPPFRGAGHGRGLVETFVEAVRAKGAAGLHVGVAPGNLRAQQFYLRLGFSRLEVRGSPGAYYYGVRWP